MVNISNEINPATVLNTIPDVISGRLVWFTDFQRKHRFGSKIAERVVEWQTRLSVMINTSN